MIYSFRKATKNMVTTIALVTAGVCMVGMFVVYGVYGGVHDSLRNARVGQVYNFVYEQPVHGYSERYLAKVLDVSTLSEDSIRRLNARSNYRRDDIRFLRTSHLVTAQTPDGKIRNFYAERASHCRRPLLAKAFFGTRFAKMIA